MPHQDFVSVNCQVVQLGSKAENFHIARSNSKKNITVAKIKFA
jgi:hypothetical protein